MAGTTDALLAVAQQAGAGESRTVASLIARLRSRHAEAARALLPAGRARTEVLSHIAEAFDELEALAQGLRLLRELTPRTTDYLVSRGERLSARLVAGALDAAGTKARYVEALDVDPHRQRLRACRARLSPHRSRSAPGAGPAARPRHRPGDARLHRRHAGGRDRDARPRRHRPLRDARGARARRLTRLALEGRAGSPHRRSPRRARRARHSPAALSRGGGAGLLRRQGAAPSRADPARRIAAFPSSSARSATRIPGTEVSERVAPARFPVKALTAAMGQALVTVTGNGMLGVPGIAARTFAALHGRQISVSLISQASSEHSICFSVPETAAADARESLEREFKIEIGRGEIDGVELNLGMATIAVVGLGMHGTPGHRRRCLLRALGGQDQRRGDRAGLVGAQHLGGRRGGGGRRSAAADPCRVPALAHRRWRGDPARADGGHSARLREHRPSAGGMIGGVRRPALSLQVAGIIDRSGFVFDPRGLSAAPARGVRPGEASRPEPRGPSQGPGGHRGGGRGAHGGLRAHAARAGGSHLRRHRARRSSWLSPTAWISCSPTSGRSRAAARSANRSGRRRAHAGGGCCTRRRSARDCRSSTRTTSSPRAATGWTASRGCSRAPWATC